MISICREMVVLSDNAEESHKAKAGEGPGGFQEKGDSYREVFQANRS